MAHSNSGETGRTFEEDRLYPFGDPRLRAVKAARATDVPYRQYRDAIHECLNGATATAYDPEKEAWDPPTKWTSDVHYRLADRLGLKNWKELQFQPTLGTSADRHHGIDLIIALDTPMGRKIVTVDFTLQPAKESYKADVIVTATGVYPNPARYPDLQAVEIPDMDGDEQGIELERREAVADTLFLALQRTRIERTDRPHAGPVRGRQFAVRRAEREPGAQMGSAPRASGSPA